MFRSSLRFRGAGLVRVLSSLWESLSVAGIGCHVTAGLVDREKAKKWKVRPLPPAGQERLSIDLCRIHASRAHLAQMERQLQRILTATCGHDDIAFVRGLSFWVSLLELLSRYHIAVRADVVPCGGE